MRIDLFRNIGCITAPRIILRALYHLGLQWIQMDVPADIQKIIRGLDNFRSISSLKHMADKMMAFIKVHRIIRIKHFHDMFWMVINRFDFEVNMVGHEAV